MVIFAGIIFVLGYFVVPKIMKMVEREKSTVTFFSVSVMIVLFLALISRHFEIGGSILGALFGGIIIRHTLLSGDKYERSEEGYITDIIEVTTFGFFAPFFFIWIGLNVDLSIIYEFPFHVLLFFVLASVGKIFGAYFGNFITHGKSFKGYIIGWGMNTRGEVDIMIATLALTIGVISVNIFSLIVFTSFATTVISPIVFEWLVKKHHGL